MIYGKSGSGKSRSLKNFAPDEIFLINVVGKRLPFPGTFRYQMKTDSYQTITTGLQKMPTKTAVIDDAGYLLTNTFMKGHSAPKAGSSTFDLYNDIADNFWRLLMFIQAQLPEDVIVYILMHETTSDFGETKLRTIGKLLDEKVCIEGMVTICLRCMVEGDRHFFRTQSNGMDISKSPEGLFDLEIENDLKFVDQRIREYWGLSTVPADGKRGSSEHETI